MHPLGRAEELTQPSSLRSPPHESCPAPHTGTLNLRFPWGQRAVEADPLTLQSFSPRERAYLGWLFGEPYPISETKANHLSYLTQPRSFYPGKLIRAARNRRQRWHTLGAT